MDEWHFGGVMWGLQLLHTWISCTSTVPPPPPSSIPAAGPTLPSFTLLLFLAAHLLQSERQIAIFWRLLSPDLGGRPRTVAEGDAGFSVSAKPVSRFTVCCQITVNSIFAPHFRSPPLSPPQSTWNEWIWRRRKTLRRREPCKNWTAETQTPKRFPVCWRSCRHPAARPSTTAEDWSSWRRRSLAVSVFSVFSAERHHFFSSPIIFSALLSPLHWFTYFTAPWLNGPSGAKVKWLWKKGGDERWSAHSKHGGPKPWERGVVGVGVGV